FGSATAPVCSAREDALRRSRSDRFRSPAPTVVQRLSRKSMMQLTKTCWIVLMACALGIPQPASAEGPPELKVHLAQANNDSPYTFVRAKFEPGEVADPWAVRFFDDKGKEVHFFVQDSITWRVAREGRADWGQRYALLNHAPGNAPQVIEA